MLITPEYAAAHAAEIKKKKRLIGFDLDGTLTQHRSPLTPEARALLTALDSRYKILMVGAGNCPRIYAQMGQFPIDIIGNYGMQESRMVDGRFTLVKDLRAEVDRDFFLREAAYFRRKYGYTQYKGESVEFHESGMATFALLGTKADIADKLAFDPDRSRRRVMYPEVCEVFRDYTVYIGGSSSFDIALKRFNKYDALVSWGAENGFSVDEMLYVGDDFDDGGGDSHIRIKGMDYVRIEDWRTTPARLQFLL